MTTPSPPDPGVQLEAILRKPRRLAADPRQGKLQLAALYYMAKATGTARAAQSLLQQKFHLEALLLIRSLYNLAVDYLWLCQDPLTRAERFYNATGVALDKMYDTLSKAGVQFDGQTAEQIESNRSHAQRVKNGFTNRGGQVRPEWTKGSIRQRAEELGRSDPELKGLADQYDLIYGTLSHYEHSHPLLCFQYVRQRDGFINAVEQEGISDEQARHYGSLLGLLVGIVIKASIKNGIIDKEELSRGR